LSRCLRRHRRVRLRPDLRRIRPHDLVDYANPSTLQIVLEVGALAVIERPVQPFGLLTNLSLARPLWLERAEHERRLKKLERKISGVQKIQKAKRITVEDMAAAIINANDLLKPAPKDV
jgi:hypothetical protein